MWVVAARIRSARFRHASQVARIVLHLVQLIFIPVEVNFNYATIQNVDTNVIDRELSVDVGDQMKEMWFLRLHRINRL